MLKAVDRPIILCVEDEPTLLRDLCDELREAGYDAMGALAGQHHARTDRV